jgi:hypothetical protein
VRAFRRVWRPQLGAAAGSWRTTSIEDAVVELYLLSRCKRVVGTYWSSFGWLAALIGQVPFLRVEGCDVVPHEGAGELVMLAGRHASASPSAGATA